MLATNPDIKRGGDQAKLHDVTLSDLGITPIQSHRWQLEAGVLKNHYTMLLFPS